MKLSMAIPTQNDESHGVINFRSGICSLLFVTATEQTEIKY